MWNELSMTDKAKYIQLGVSNGITNLDIIRDTYNKLKINRAIPAFSNGGGIINKFSGEENNPTQQMSKASPMPWYKKAYYTLTGAPVYDTGTLKEAITKAYNEGHELETIIWNNNAYTAEFSPQDYQEYLDNSRMGTFATMGSSNPDYSAIDKEFSKYRDSPYDTWDNAKNWAEKNGYLEYMSSQARRVQKSRVKLAYNQDPIPTGRRNISLADTYSKDDLGSMFDLRSISYNPDYIDAIARNLPPGMDIYEALTLPIHETHLGQGSKGTNLPLNQGVMRALINNHAFELDTSYFSDIAQHIRNVAHKKIGETNKAYRKRLQTYISASKDIDEFKRKYPDIYKAANADAKARFNRKRWEHNNSEASYDGSYLEHALKKYHEGTYNSKEPEYVTNTKKYIKVLKRSKELEKYLRSNKYIK